MITLRKDQLFEQEDANSFVIERILKGFENIDGSSLKSLCRPMESQWIVLRYLPDLNYVKSFLDLTADPFEVIA
jgi:hypothetical protein